MMLEVRVVASREKELDSSWSDINYFQSVCEMFSDVQGPQSDYIFSDVMTVFQKNFGKEHIELIVKQTNLCVQQYIQSDMCKFMGTFQVENGKM
jgi:hypothetical protein